jgi:hypothetical protein
MYEQFAHVAVPSLADAEKLLLPAGRVFPRHEAEPRRQIAGFLELPSTANRCKKCSRPQCSDAGDRHETSGHILSTGNRLDFVCDVTDALLQLPQIGKQVCEQLTHRRGQSAFD